MLSINRLDLNDAHLLIEGAKKKAGELGVPLCIAVVDESGGLIAFDRMNGGRVSSVAIAMEMAYSAAATCHEILESSIQNGQGKQALNRQASAISGSYGTGGGIPVSVEGQVVGGIGISSGRPGESLVCAQEGIEYFQLWRTGPKLKSDCA